MKDELFAYLHGKGGLAGVKTAADFEALCGAVRDDAAGRLRWQLCRRLGLAPFQGRPARGDYLYAAAQLFLDREAALDALCPACRAKAEAERCGACGAPLPTQNPAFDENRYEELKQNGQPEL